MARMIEEHLRLDADLTEGVSGALSLVECGDVDAARTRPAPPRNVIGPGFSAMRSGRAAIGADLVVMNRAKNPRAVRSDTSATVWVLSMRMSGAAARISSLISRYRWGSLASPSGSPATRP